jgi:prepilin-type N-terminal cleavage/methylation domain-containing protein/prepilin-type processing-associated H-X9-DG protein
LLVRTTTRSGFSLIELLVVLAIVGVLMGLLLPALQYVRESANRCCCANNLKQIGLAMRHHHDTRQSLPPGVSYRNGADPFPFMSWQTRILPFVEQQNLWTSAEQAFAQNKNFLDNPPHIGFATVVPLFACPSDSRTLSVAQLRGGRRVAFTAYLGVEGKDQNRQDGVLYLDSHVTFRDVTDGLSNTLMVGERPPSADGIRGWWYAGWGQEKDGSGDMVLGVREWNVGPYGPQCPVGPYHFGPGRIDNQCDAFHFWSRHAGGAHFLFCDGSVHFLQYSADPILPALATRKGGEAVTVPD